MAWVLLNLQQRMEKEETLHLKRLLSCLTSSLPLALEQRSRQGIRRERKDEASLGDIASPLVALRTFSKLLIRRLEKDESTDVLNLELARNILIQSERLVEILVQDNASVSETGEREPRSEGRNLKIIILTTIVPFCYEHSTDSSTRRGEERIWNGSDTNGQKGGGSLKEQVFIGW